MTNPTTHGIMVGDTVTINQPAMPCENGPLTVTAIVGFDRLVLQTPGGTPLWRDVNDFEVTNLATKRPLPLSAQAGRRIVHLHEVRTGVYRVEVRVGGLGGFGGTVDEELTRSFDGGGNAQAAEYEARRYARQATRDLRDLATIEAVTA
jgi:hypothetical protein